MWPDTNCFCDQSRFNRGVTAIEYGTKANYQVITRDSFAQSHKREISVAQEVPCVKDASRICPTEMQKAVKHGWMYSKLQRFATRPFRMTFSREHYENGLSVATVISIIR